MLSTLDTAIATGFTCSISAVVDGTLVDSLFFDPRGRPRFFAPVFERGSATITGLISLGSTLATELRLVSAIFQLEFFFLVCLTAVVAQDSTTTAVELISLGSTISLSLDDFLLLFLFFVAGAL